MDVEKFKECNVIMAENQPEYLDLPCYKDEEGTLTTCWKLSWRERFQIFKSGKMWLKIMTFHQPLQPLKMSTTKPNLEERIDD
jgi:hypothetical protein